VRRVQGTFSVTLFLAVLACYTGYIVYIRGDHFGFRFRGYVRIPEDGRYVFGTNSDDGSALLQVVTRNSLGDNAEFLAAINLPIGPGGTEFGGIEAGMPGVYLSSDFSLFAQFAWYF